MSLMVVVPGEDHAAENWAAVASIAGWSVERTLQLPEGPWNLGLTRVAFCAVVATAQKAEAAVDAAARSAALVLAVAPELPCRARLLAALRGLSPMIERTDPAGPLSLLGTEEVEVAAHVALGRSLAEAARLTHLSLRTANRRLDSARQQIGAANRRQVIVSVGEAMAPLLAAPSDMGQRSAVAS